MAKIIEIHGSNLPAQPEGIMAGIIHAETRIWSAQQLVALLADTLRRDAEDAAEDYGEGPVARHFTQLGELARQIEELLEDAIDSGLDKARAARE